MTSARDEEIGKSTKFESRRAKERFRRKMKMKSRGKRSNRDVMIILLSFWTLGLDDGLWNRYQTISLFLSYLEIDSTPRLESEIASFNEIAPLF